MPEMMKLYSEVFVNEIKPSFDPYKNAKKLGQDFMTFSAEFEKRVNDILREGWTLVNTNISNQGIMVTITAILKKQV